MTGCTDEIPDAKNIQDAQDAYDRGDYKTAFTMHKELAEQSDIGSQTLLGYMYYEGQGVTQDYKKAVHWYTKGSEQGFEIAQLNLGVMYANGQGVSKDYEKAHMYWNIASANGNEDAKESRDEIEESMTPEQIAEAQELASEWMEKHSK